MFLVSFSFLKNQKLYVIIILANVWKSTYATFFFGVNISIYTVENILVGSYMNFFDKQYGLRYII